jgi:hypothetical protein
MRGPFGWAVSGADGAEFTTSVDCEAADLSAADGQDYAGWELTDVYALTMQEDAGLEIHHIELGPAEAPR